MTSELRSLRFALTSTAILVVAIMAASMTSAGSNAVRVPDAEAHRLTELGIQAQVDLDYGSFRWLVVDDENLLALQQSAVPFTKVHDAGTVQVQGFRFDPLEGTPSIPERLSVNTDREGLHLLQLVGPVRDGWVTQLEAAGVELLQYYPHNGYLVWANPAELEEIQRLPFVRWQGPFHPAYKINSNLAGRSGAIQNLDVMFYNNGRVDDVLEELEKFGGVVLRHAPSQPDGRFFSAIVSANAAQIETIAGMGHVLWLGYQSPEPGLDDEMSDQIIADNHPGGVPVTGYNAHLAGLGFDGTGVVWATVDTGVDYDHPDLGPRIVGGYSFPNTCSDPPGDDCLPYGGHGTHVTGIIGGDATAGYTDGNGFLYGLGVAPNYGIFAMNALMGEWPPIGGWQENSKQGVLGGAIGGNNSWWTGSSNNGYQSAERTHDLMVRDGNFDTASVVEPFIEVFSAGNSGSSGLTAPKEAKNLIVTASSRNYRAGNIDTISSFSSWGPAHDGRWVPTIAAPGEEIASTRNDVGGWDCVIPISGTDSLYAYCSGTSMAAPHTSGAIVLATQWWRGFNGGVDPSPAMAKALLVNSADDMGTPDIPNIHEGWGRINITTLINSPTFREYWDQTEIFGNTGEQIQIEVFVPDPGQPLKVTLAWSDAPGAVGANPALVNNLDLSVDTDGTTYLGNDFSAGWSTTGGSADVLNNLENVFVEPPGGSAIITIDATAIVGDGVPYNGDNTDQDFTLVCTNCALHPGFTLEVIPGSLSVCSPHDAQWDISIDSILSFNDPVALAASGEPAGTTVSFDINPVSPPGTSVLSIGNTESAAVGFYPVTISGTAVGSPGHNTIVMLEIAATPFPPGLTTPADGATDQPLEPTFQWSAVAGADAYTLEVDDDPAFGNPEIFESGIIGTSFTPSAALLGGTTYHWRVAAENFCGSGAASDPYLFTSVILLPFADGFESGDSSLWSSTNP